METNRDVAKKALQRVSGACRLFQILLELFQPWLFLGKHVAGETFQMQCLF